MGVTLKTLAEHTGFSVATISRVLNHDPTISVGEETRRIIFDTAQKLGYTGGSGRRSQRIVRDAMTIGIAEMMSPAEQMKDPYFLYLKNFVEHVCYKKNIHVVTLHTDHDNLFSMGSADIDGIIAIGYFNRAQINSLQIISSNITFLDSSPDELLYDSVVINFELGIRQALDYLRELRHTKIGFIGPKSLSDKKHHIVYEPRRRYYEHYMRQIGMFQREYVVEAPLRDHEKVRLELKQRLEEIPREEWPTALIAVNEESAIAAVHVLKELQLKIPEDISVISFNDTVMSSVVEPPLTSISPHLDYMAEIAVRLVTERASTLVHPPERTFPQKVVVPPELVKRASTSVYQ